MKKIISILFLVGFCFMSYAQTIPTEITPDDYLSDVGYVEIWGTTNDTLTNADTLSFVYRVKGTEQLDINVGLYSDYVSGTAGGELIGYYSFDGVNYFTLGDTVTVSALTEDAFDSENLDYLNYNYPYLKLEYIQTGTAVTVPKVYFYAKY